MNKHLEKAVKEFEESNIIKSSISPISRIDVNIVEKIISILKKFNKHIFVIHLLEILGMYKFFEDVKVLNELNELEKVSDYIVEEQKKRKSKEKEGVEIFYDYLCLGDFRIQIRFLYNYDKYEEYDSELMEPRYAIIFNKTDELLRDQPLYANYKMFFNSEIERDSFYIKLDKMMESRDHVRYFLKDE